ncbi:hypothetical protein K0U00_46410, partial [Paenibacillus sepulcri]|nr:hypothetical protein [Paenibacillus sepulcri]
LRKGVKPGFYPSVNVHAFLYEAGRHTLNLGKGAYTIVGIIPADQPVNERDVSPLSESARSLDWLYG